MIRKTALLAALAVSAGLATAAPAVAAEAPGHISARVQHASWVANVAGDDMKVGFQGGGYKYLIQRGDAAQRSDWTTSGSGKATKSFRSRHDKRCIRWTGPGQSDGLWKLNGNSWVSMPYHDTYVKAYPWSKCVGVARTLG
jgi:hypothetical protein